METIQANCQRCGAKMTLQVEPNSILPPEKLAKFATCDSCMRRLGRAKRSAPPPQPQRELKLPYKDT